CVEPQPQGRCEGLYSGGYSNLCRLFELALNDGRDLATEAQLGPRTGLEFASFDAFYEAYRRQMRHFIHLHAVGQNAIDLAHKDLCPTPLVSCLVDDCLDRGLDVRSGGARHNFTSPNAVGLANVADSLETIRRKVFEEKKYSLARIREILAANYAGFEAVRQEFLNDVAKYGNDVDSVDELARRVGEDYCLEWKNCHNLRGGIFQAGLQSISAHALFVGSSSASPDGRRREDLVSDGGVSPAQGRDAHGPTAVCRSVAKLNHLEATNGALLNIKFHPSAVAGERGRQNIMDLVDGFFTLGGQHAQFNVVSTEVLREAQKHPEKYGDLVVRVAGFSVLFTSLDTVLQNDIIERTEHAS
ncbi:MAG: glycyl radical protein, partial [Planctomycetes bacterium]|nr:glycyl radical protein [Planctomycetota bacterium]